MGRIRSIHPDILTDPDLTDLPRDARLFFYYIWIVADDAGNIDGSDRGLKLAVFPGDDDLTTAAVGDLKALLMKKRFLVPYTSNGKNLLHVVDRYWKYQRPDHPTAPKIPLFPGQKYTYHVRQGNTYVPNTVSGTLPEHKANVLAGEELELERKGKEVDLEGGGEDGKGTGREGERALPLPPSGGGGAAAFQKNNESNGKSTPSDKGNEADFPDYVVADINRLSPEARETMRITVNDYMSGTIPREEADATVAPFKMSRRTIDALFPIREG